jgi:N utilization substance protein B
VTTTPNPNTLARDFAVQFLYQCEADKLFYFSSEHFEAFTRYFKVDGPQKSYLQAITKGVLENLNALDERITAHSKNWKISRMPSTDRVVLRMATREILEKMAPDKVILNEAIELAKRYGTEHSGSFVNGVLDAILAEARA